MFYIRQSATHKVVLGPAVAVGDGFTPVTNLDVATSDEAEAILHDNGTVVDISGYTWAAIATADGYYHLTLQAAISGTVGHLTIVVNDDSLCLPLRADFTVLDTAAYDANFKDAAEGPLQATTVGRKLDVSATGEAGLDFDNTSGTIDAAQLGGDCITAAKIADDAISSEHLNTGCLTADAFAANALVAATFAASSLDGKGDWSITVPDAAGTAAGLHTTTDAAIAAVKAETALIVADTNELQTDDIPGTLSTIVGYLDTEIAAIKAVTDALPNSGALTTIATDTARLTAARAGALTDWINGGRLNLILDAIPTAALYHADIQLTVDDTNSKDEYTVVWFKNGVRVTSGITVPKIQVVKRADGTDLVAQTAMSQIGATGAYKYDEASNRITAGEAVFAVVTATIDGSGRSFAKVLTRDSSS